eukprot:2001923-Prorocentrum_lima.AAC.1
MEVGMKDITGLHKSQNEMLDELQIPGRRIPSDFITKGHTQGVAGDIAVTQGPRLSEGPGNLWLRVSLFERLRLK